MTKRQKKRKNTSSRQKVTTSISNGADSTFFLKIVVFMIIGSQWLYIEKLPDWQIPIPIGLAIGLVFATHEHFMIDRKIEYVILLFSAFISFWLPIGIIISI